MTFFEQFAIIPVILFAVSTLVLLLSQNWRISIIALAIQYLGVFWLTSLMWSPGQAAVKLVAGWMAGAVLGASQPEPEQIEDPYTGSSAFVFRLLVAGLVFVLLFPAAPALMSLLAGLVPTTLSKPLPLAAVQGALLLVGMGVLHLGMTTRPLRVLLGLLTALSGFEILYAGVERSVLVAGLLVVITLGLAFVGAYLLAILPAKDESPSGEELP